MMDYPAEARTGREKQRYDEDDVRQVRMRHGDAEKNQRGLIAFI